MLRTENDLKAFYDAHYRSAVQQAFRIVNDLAAAEDAVQDCLVRLWERRVEISAKGDVLPYFRRMVRNRSIDLLRRRLPVDGSADASEVEYLPPDTLAYRDLARSVDAIIDGLPEKCRQVFVLSRFEQMSYKEISEQLSIAPKTVENQINRALKALRAGLPGDLLVFFL